MSHSLVDVATYSSGITAPSAGDDVTAASVEVGEQALANRTAWLLSKGFGGTSGTGQHISPAGLSYGLVSRSVTRVQSGFWVTTSGTVVTPTSPIFFGSGGKILVTDDAEMLVLVPHGATITDVTMTIAPQTHAALPGTMPRIGLYKWTVATATRSFIDEKYDTTSPFGAYNLVHSVTLTLATPEVVNRATSYYLVRFSHEDGANATFMSPPAVSITYTTSAIDDGY